MNSIELIDTEAPDKFLLKLMTKLHTEGPIEQNDLESLAYLKHFHSEAFSVEESKLMYLLGLFYKTDEPDDLISLTYSIYSESIEAETGQKFTPVQASIRQRIIENKYFSFSAPTSAGKSFLFRELIKKESGDIIILVPSRALIAEYILAVREIVRDQRDILVLQFIEDVNKKKTSRRVFVVTPERASELFKYPSLFNPTLFLFDEAQISEEKIRGVSFDSFVRRSVKNFPTAKKVFAHPFVDNPDAQLNKHNFYEDSDSEQFKQNAVGKIYLYFNRSGNKFECFSPFIENAHLKSNKYTFDSDIVADTLANGGSILVYISKKSIYEKTFEDTFSHYIAMCPAIEDKVATEIIDEVEELIGAKGRDSELVELMRKGVVIHHGSVPLSVRFLIEKFTNFGFARICFATSTLAQGVNMPFDVVWVENIKFVGSEEDKVLGLKNLIGRAGRSTDQVNHFDYGFVVVHNIKKFVDKFSGRSVLSDISQLDKEPYQLAEDLGEFITAVKNEDLNDNYNLPNTKTERLKSTRAFELVNRVLDFLFVEGQLINGTTYQNMQDSERKKLKNDFGGIYELSLGRPLNQGEKSVLSASITILLWQIQGKSFKELLGLRYSYLTNQTEQRKLQRQFKEGIITKEKFEQLVSEIKIVYSAIPHSLPDASLSKQLPSRFGNKTIKDFNYDLVVYDTYDFLDKVISFSLSETFVAAFDQFYEHSKDPRAKEMVNYFRYGTNDEIEIWLIRYGFSIEDAEKIKRFVLSIDEREINFSEKIYLDENFPMKSLVERYL